MRSLLLRRLAPLLVLLAVTASACGATEDRAATVNGKDISARSMQDELKTIRSNSAYRKALEGEQGYGIKLAGASKGTFNSAFSAQLLTLRVYYELIEQDLAKQGVRVTKAEDREATSTLKSQVSQLGTGVWTSFPVEYRNRLGHQEALISKATAEAGKDVEVACVSHILVTADNRTDAEAKALAQQLKDQIDAGADFATVAKASSEDPGSKEQGGDLGCQPKGVYDADFEQAVWSQPIGKLSDPVKTQFGYHLIVVQSRQKGGSAAAASQGSQQAFSAYLLKLMCGTKTKVSVDPQFGTWDRSPCKGQQGLAKVTAPKKPATNTSK
jgi:parvulin-like peptidyl-prolyl isomerase